MTEPGRTVFRPIPDPQAEVERLAAARAGTEPPYEPPGREWGIRHPGPDGTITVTSMGHPFLGRFWAERERDALNKRCGLCRAQSQGTGGHTLVYRDPAPWIDET